MAGGKRLYRVGEDRARDCATRATLAHTLFFFPDWCALAYFLTHHDSWRIDKLMNPHNIL